VDDREYVGEEQERQPLAFAEGVVPQANALRNFILLAKI